MGKINVLSFAVANLIAAGEVVDRPASVIKELMENSIDSGADRITVEIQNGGIAFMRVSDNGCGIEPEDLPVALRRHATSKIKEADDLDSIMSLGFRGEALAAISSVSNVRIISKTRENQFGAMVECHGGVGSDVIERGCSDGTTVIVEDLFYNVPARRKFLKKDVTEAMAVVSTVERVALSHPEIAFTLISDGVTRLTTSGDGKAKSAIYSVFGREFASKLLEVNSSLEGIKISGYIGRSDNVKATRNYQNFFINGRYIKSKTAMAAIEQAYNSYIPPEKFPCCVIFVDINPRTVDVNVHPSKLEVKFSNEKLVFEAIYYACRNALEQNTERPSVKLENGHISAEDYRRLGEGKADGKSAATSGGFSRGVSAAKSSINVFVPIADVEKTSQKDTQIRQENFSLRLNQDTVKIPTSTYFSQKNNEEPIVSIPKIANPRNAADDGRNITSNMPSFENPPPRVSNDEGRENIVRDYRDAFVKKEGASPSPQHAAADTTGMFVEKKKEEERALLPYRFIGEAFDSYLLVDIGEKLLIIDKHAAHERIIFERFKEIIKSREDSSQLLMLPISVHLGREECAILSEYKNEIEAVGYTIDVKDNCVDVTSIPTGIPQGATEEIMQTFADRLLGGAGNVSITRDMLFEKALYQASCKAAIKAGRKYPEGHTEWLVKKMMELPDITFCPHGRPVAIEMTKNMLDKQFERL